MQEVCADERTQDAGDEGHGRGRKRSSGSTIGMPIGVLSLFMLDYPDCLS